MSRLPRLLLLPLLLLAPACGGEEAPSFRDASDAITQGQKARANKDWPLAAAAFEYVAGSNDAPAEMRFDALLGLGQAQARLGQAGPAQAAFDRLLREFPDRVDADLLKTIGDAWIYAGDPDRAEAVARMGAERFPDSEYWGKLGEAIEAVRSGASAADLAQLGYTD